MEKQKRWQFYLIVAVLVLTLYNIFPTILYYSKPLKSTIDSKRAESVASAMITRVNSMEQASIAWLKSFSNLLGIKPSDISLRKDNPRLVDVTFKNAQDAKAFSRFLPAAGERIGFVPAQLNLYSADHDNTVTVARQISVHLEQKDLNKLFNFSKKYDDNGQLTSLYRDIVYDRTTQLGLGFGGPSKGAIQLAAIAEHPQDADYDDLVVSVAKDIANIDRTFGSDSAIAKRFFASYTQIDAPNAKELPQQFIARSEKLTAKLNTQKEDIESNLKTQEEQGQLIDSEQEYALSMLNSQIRALKNANEIISKNNDAFKAGKTPLTEKMLQDALISSAKTINTGDQLQTISLEGRHPLFQELTIDWSNDRILTKLYADVQSIRDSQGKTETSAFAKDQLNHLVINDVARVSRLADETISPEDDQFAVNLSTITNSQSLLAFDLGFLAEKQSQQILEQISSSWQPQHSDFIRESFPVRDYDTFKEQSLQDQKLGLVVYAPAHYEEAPPEGFRKDSIYVIVRGFETITQRYRDAAQSEDSQLLMSDIDQLASLMKKNGFIAYSGASYGIAPEFKNDLIFAMDDYYANLLSATRENFIVKGSKRFATLDFTDVEQRLQAMNKIDDSKQEDLVRWQEEYQAAQADIDVTHHFLVPAPTKNVYWQNLKLSFVKYFRGDSDNVLKWGLDLSGGKTVRIGLRDQNNRPVTDPDDLKQAVNELYNRVNKLGVSERTIRIENENIILDFPGSQNLSAADLIKASAMYFHIVNEKFSPRNQTLKEAVSGFLQNIWNEAVVTNRKDIESINEIAWQHLGGEVGDLETTPRSEYAKILYDNGLRLTNPRTSTISSEFNDSLSSIAMFGDSDSSQWENQANPLIIVFHNYALEGSSLTNVTVGYDPSKGNLLSFGVKRSYEGHNSSGSPREDFYIWTSNFAEARIQGTPKEAYTQGRGWRMAVILNNRIVNAPSLNDALRDGGTISGRFSQREINQLAADLKAGSLSFTPKILSEHNVSPELGKEERSKGIMASVIALVLVIITMISYYRFAGLVASCAVTLNLLIMWGVLQNLDAALTLPGIAAIVLTIGMAVDANVLVFERIREEFAVSGRIASAIQAGYRKAFSAIVDSNITTIIAALILIQFDSGPIKGFAVTLIIGIVSSMFTALFLTRYFFAGWVQNPKNKSLTMSQMISNTKFDFIKQSKAAVIISVIVMVIGGYFFVTQRNTLFGMDFTGGYSLTMEVEEKPGNPSYRMEAINALLASGVFTNEFQVRELSKPDQLRVQLSVGMEEKGRPFYQMPEALTSGKFAYEFEKNPRIVWLVNALQDHGLTIQKSQLESLDKQWTAMGSQFSDAMRNNAIIALSLALLSILIYITIRFEFKYAIAAVVALAHDVFITLGIFALFHRLGFHVQIDLQVIGAIMTIIGYSLNDTIIIFDRIREDIRVLRKMPFKDIVNHALNVTLGRTLMTSGTTLVVLITLVTLGGPSIFDFSLVMTIGVLIGTLSSLFVASPVMLYFHDREEKQKNKNVNPRRA